MRSKHVPSFAQRHPILAVGVTGAVTGKRGVRRCERTFTKSFRYTFSLFGAVRCFFLLRPPAFKSIPCVTANARMSAHLADDGGWAAGVRRKRAAHHGCC